MCATLDRTDIKAHTLHWTQLRCNFHEVLFVACARLVSSPKLETETASQHSAFRSRWANCVAGWKQQHQRFELSCSVATQFWKWPLASCKSKVKSPKPSNPEPKLHLRAHPLPFSCEQRPSSWKAPCNLNAMNHRVRAATFKENQCFFMFLCTSSTIRIAFRILPSSRSGDIALDRCPVVKSKIHEHPTPLLSDLSDLVINPLNPRDSINSRTTMAHRHRNMPQKYLRHLKTSDMNSLDSLDSLDSGFGLFA